LVTLGSRGCKFQNKIYPVDKVEIKDMSGAGDTFISCLVVEMIKSGDIDESINEANRSATIIVQQKGVNRIGEFINK
jgi:D-beta-D-heptose 7-phosphate kinase/D-beta-D-heptose 1-phosphate adenosyltransferase